MSVQDFRQRVMHASVQDPELGISSTDTHKSSPRHLDHAADTGIENLTSGSHQALSASLPSTPTPISNGRSQLYRHWTKYKARQCDGPRSSHFVNSPPLPGYPKLALLLGQCRGGAVFRQFSALNIRMILYLQAEILELEEELDKLEHENDKTNKRLKFEMNVLKASKMSNHESERLQHEITLELRTKLKEYNTLLLEQAALNRLDRAPSADVFELKSFLERSKNGLERPEIKVPEKDKNGKPLVPNHWWMDPIEGSVYMFNKDGKVVENDLIVLSERKFDLFTGAIRRLLTCLAKKAPGLTKRMGIVMEPDIGVVIQDDFLSRVSKLVAVGAASIVPIASIFALYYIRSMSWRLGFIMLWSVFFSVCLTCFTTAKTIEIFSASVAMAAIQVVFVAVQPGVPQGQDLAG